MAGYFYSKKGGYKWAAYLIIVVLLSDFLSLMFIKILPTSSCGLVDVVPYCADYTVS